MYRTYYTLSNLQDNYKTNDSKQEAARRKKKKKRQRSVSIQGSKLTRKDGIVWVNYGKSDRMNNNK